MATATKKRKATGGPRSALTERSMIRHAPGEWEAWERQAFQLGFGGVSGWLRKLANDAVAAAKPSGGGR